MSLTIAIVSLIAFLIALSFHEFCHALVAYGLGDRTAQRYGRLTLNPLAHIDPIGTILVPLLGLISGLPVFGWAKPVPVNPYNLRHGKWGSVMVSLIGPVSNFTLVLVFLVLLRIAYVSVGLPITNLLVVFLIQLVTVNVVLGLFNLLPIPPLDGSSLLAALLDSPKYQPFLRFLQTRGTFILFGLLILDSLMPNPFLGLVFGKVLSGAFAMMGL